MALILQNSPLASTAATFACNSGLVQGSVVNSIYYGVEPTLHTSVFTGGLANGFNINTGVLFTTQSLAGALSSPASGQVGVTFTPTSARNILLTHCSCDGDGADSQIVINSANGLKATYDLYLDPSEYVKVPRSRFPNLPSQTGNDCTCRSGPYSFYVDGRTSIGLTYSGKGSDYLMYGFVGTSHLPSTTSFSLTVTESPTISALSTTRTTTPFAYSTKTTTPVGPTITVTPTTISTSTLPASTVTVTPLDETTTSTASPTCTLYQVGFPARCCPRDIVGTGAATLGPIPSATPAPGNVVPRSLADADEADDLLKRQATCSASTSITSGTIATSSNCATTTRLPAVTVFTGTTTSTVASSFISTVTAPVPDAVTASATNTVTSVVTETPDSASSTLPVVTQTLIAAAACTTTTAPAFRCPAIAHNQAILSKLTQPFLDTYKKLVTPRAPQVAVSCDADSTLYNY